jgi:hypothetical protein
MMEARMRFDPRKPHGTITGHRWARYEQNGTLFDASGNTWGEEPAEDEVELEIQPVTQPDEQINNSQRDFALDNAKAFLKNILAQGSLTRSVVFRECAANNQDWEKIKEAFATLGEPFSRKNIVHWKLKVE